MVDITRSRNISITGGRLVANVVDNMIITLFTFFAVLAIAFFSLEIFNVISINELLMWNINSYVETEGTYGLLKGAIIFALYIMITYTALSIIYFQYFLTTPQRSTIGMKLFKLQLEGVDGAKLSFSKVFARNILFIIFKFIYIGSVSIITMIITKEGQALHDMATGTKVVYKK